MPWKETDAMNERIRYALAYECGLIGGYLLPVSLSV